MFWLQLLMIAAAAWLVFAYVGYPLALWVLARVSPRPVKRADIAPAVSIIPTRFAIRPAAKSATTSAITTATC